MGTTQADLLIGFSRLIGDYVPRTTSGAGAANGVTLVDAGLTPSPDNAFRGRWVRLPATLAEADKNRLVTASTQSSGTLTVTPGFPTQVGAGVAYQLHRYDPALKLQALNDARTACFRRLFVQVEDTSLTVTGGQYSYPLPTGVVELRQVWLQQNTTVADFPYELLPSPEAWDLADTNGTRTLRLSAATVARGAGKKLRLVWVRPFTATAVDTDSIETDAADDLLVLYTKAAVLLFARMQTLSPAQESSFYAEQAARWDREAERLLQGHRRRWPMPARRGYRE